MDFILVEGDILTLLSMKDLVENGLDVALQDELIIFKDRLQPLTF